MIPKDILANLYLKLFHAEIKRGGRTVRSNRADRPAAPGGLSARSARTVRVSVGRRCFTGRSGGNNGPSVTGVRTVRAPRGLSAVVSRTVRPCRARVGPKPRDVVKQPSLLLSQTRTSPLLSLFLAPTQRKGLPLRDFVPGTPRTVRAHPRTLREVLHHVIWVLFRIPPSISWILSKKVIRVWR
jgi:hypothetical protein